MTPPAERCPTCDRDTCSVAASKLSTAERKAYAALLEAVDRGTSFDPESRAVIERSSKRAGDALADCYAHRVDWRARALAAEARIATVAAEIEHDVGVKRSHDHGRATGGQTVGTGGPLTGAPQSMLRYLDRVVRDLHDDRTRAIADHAAQWAKVAPLIERLREEVGSRDVYDLIDAVHFLLAATEATP